MPIYDSYQDSGFAWLGAVPSHWTLKRLAHFFDERREKCSDVEYPALSVTKNGIVPQLENAAKTDDGDNRKKVIAGDFVINSRSDRKGSSGLSALDGSISLINTVLTPMPSMWGQYAHHLLRSICFQEEYYRYGKGIVADLWSTNYSEMRNILLAVPPVTEQVAIAAFLDRETGKIDALVEAQRRLVELLKEKRRAVISRAVTKGLDSTVPMKDIGVEWLGQVPAHWEVRRVKGLASVISKGTTPTTVGGEFVDEGVRFLKAENVTFGGVEEDPAFFISEETDTLLARSRLQEGDILVVIAGATTGKSAVLQASLCPCNTNQAVSFVRLLDPTTASFVNFYIGSDLVQRFISSSAVQSAQPNLSMEDLGNIAIPVPPIAELFAIIDFLGGELKSSTELERQAELAIALLQERRGTLISAAVTGKIDVRGLIPVEAKAA